jgi:hypothetical protein
VIAAVLGIVGFAIQTELLTWDQRAKGLFDDPNMYGVFLVPAILFCIYMIYYRIGRRWLISFALLVLAIGELLSFSRAAQVACLICLIGYLIFLNRLCIERLLPVILAVIGGALVLFAIIYFVSEDFAEKFLQRFTVAEPYDLGKEGRYGRYLLVLPMILDHPTGLGLLQLDKIFPEPIHNIWLSSFVNYGWNGGITWITLFVSSIVVSVQNYRRTRNPLAILLMFSLLAFILCATLHQAEHWRHMWLFFGLLWGFNADYLSRENRVVSRRVYVTGPPRLTAPASVFPAITSAVMAPTGIEYALLKGARIPTRIELDAAPVTIFGPVPLPRAAGNA